jgi:serine/threonine protein kinase
VKALQRLHESGGGGRVHGDVKRENFNLTAQGLVKLLDFGFMMDLGTENRSNVHVLGYSSPQVRRRHAFALGLRYRFTMCA